MKKVMAILFAILMVLSLFACNKTDTTEESAAPDTSAQESAATDETAQTTEAGTETDAGTDTTESRIGFYNSDYDYSANDTYKVVYMMSQTGVLYDMFDKAFAEWAALANVEYSSFSANADNDLFLTTIETYAAQGVDGYLFDADNTIYPAVNDVMKRFGTAVDVLYGRAARYDDGNRLPPGRRI